MRTTKKLTETDFVFNEKNLMAFLDRVRRRAVAMGLSHELVDDVVQEAAVAAIMHKRFYNKITAVVCTSLSRLYGNTTTKRRKAKLISIDELISDEKFSYTQTPEKTVECLDRFETLNLDQKGMLDAVYAGGKSVADLAHDRGVSRQAVDQRLSKMRCFIMG